MMQKRIYEILNSIILIIFYFTYTALFKYALIYLGIDFTTISDNLLILINFLINFLFIIILVFIYLDDLKKNLKDYKENFSTYFPYGLKWWLIGLAIMIGSNMIIMQIYPSRAANETIIVQELQLYPLYMCFSTMIYAPFVEEIIFRKTMNGIFKNNFLYILVCGLLFGFIHILANATVALEYLYMIPYGIYGSIFAYLFVKTKNIFVPMTFHFIHNFIIIAFYILSLGISL